MILKKVVSKTPFILQKQLVIIYQTEQRVTKQ